LASVTGAYAERYRLGSDWQQHQRWYAVLHRFDRQGRHLGSDIWYAGTTAQGQRAVVEQAEQRLTLWLDALPDREYADIAVRPFRLEVDGVGFGLVVCSDPEVDDWVVLYPDDLCFYAPWDGRYDT
jgi:hypothetical protein